MIANLALDRDVFTSNVFLVTGERTALVDVGNEFDVVEAVEAHVDDLDVVVLTHTHYDHVANLESVLDAFDVDVVAFDGDAEGVTQVLGDGESVQIGDHEYVAIHTPGHKNDHLCLYSGDPASSSPVTSCSPAAVSAAPTSTRATGPPDREHPARARRRRRGPPRDAHRARSERGVEPVPDHPDGPPGRAVLTGAVPLSLQSGQSNRPVDMYRSPLSQNTVTTSGSSTPSSTSRSATSLAAGSTPRGLADQNPLFLGQTAAFVLGVVERHRRHVVGRSTSRLSLTNPGPIPGNCPRRCRVPSPRDRVVGGFDRHDVDVGEFLAEPSPDTGDRPTGADARHEGVDGPVADLVEDFDSRRLVVGLRVGRVLELAQLDELARRFEFVRTLARVRDVTIDGSISAP